MNFKVFALFIACALVVCSASPAPPQVEAAGKTFSFELIANFRRDTKFESFGFISKFLEPADNLIQPFISCDLIGSGAFCAVRCIAMGYKGGYCNDQKVCVCRN